MSQGFSKVYGEVCDVDVYGISDTETVSVEMKKSLNIKVLSQAMDNVSTSHYAYVAVPYRKNLSESWKVLRKLGLGLIVVQNGQARFSLKAPKSNPKRTLVKNVREHHEHTIGGKKTGENPTAYSYTMDKVRKVLEEAGKPVDIDYIFERVETHYTGKNKKASLRNTLQATWNRSWIKSETVGKKVMFSLKGDNEDDKDSGGNRPTRRTKVTLQDVLHDKVQPKQR